MADQLIKVEIITPTKTLFSGNADTVTLPGECSEFQILHNHAPIVSSLQAGVIKIELNGKMTKFAVNSGLAEVRNNYVSILANVAETNETIDAENIQSLLNAAKAKLMTQVTDAELITLNQNIKFYNAQLKAIEK